MFGILYYQPSINARMLGRIMGLSERQVQRMQKELREDGLLKREGSLKHGKWVCEWKDDKVTILYAQISRCVFATCFAYLTEVK